MRLDNSARMNFPGTTKDNWGWRIGEPGRLGGAGGGGGRA